MAATHVDPSAARAERQSILVENYLLTMSKPGGTGILIRVEDTDRTGAWAVRSPFTGCICEPAQPRRVTFTP